MFKENSLCDVTLVSDDKIRFQAHKFVLSAASPLLTNVLLDNSQSHPQIFLRGVKHKELKSIFQFIYLGESAVHKDNMNKFIQAAKDLEIKQFAANVILGNPFNALTEDADFSLASNNDEISNQEMVENSDNVEDDAEYEKEGRSISNIEIIDLDIPAKRDKFGYVTQL